MKIIISQQNLLKLLGILFYLGMLLLLIVHKSECSEECGRCFLAFCMFFLTGGGILAAFGFLLVLIAGNDIVLFKPFALELGRKRAIKKDDFDKTLDELLAANGRGDFKTASKLREKLQGYA